MNGQEVPQYVSPMLALSISHTYTDHKAQNSLGGKNVSNHSRELEIFHESDVICACHKLSNRLAFMRRKSMQPGHADPMSPCQHNTSYLHPNFYQTAI